jgi:histidinol-phosphate aminotransferase
MSDLWSDLTHTLSPYVPGEQPRIAGLIKLNTNESPLGRRRPRRSPPSPPRPPNPCASTPTRRPPSYAQAWPPITASRLDQVFVGNGSDEVLAHAFAALLKHDAPLLFPDITYSFYPVYSRLFGIEAQTVPLDEAFQDPRRRLPPPAGAIILPNPNAPTGVALPLADIQTLLADHPDVPVVIDEAYVDFGADTAIPLIARIRTCWWSAPSPSPGRWPACASAMRSATQASSQALTRVKDSFNSYPLGRPAQAGAIASVQDEGYFQATLATLIAGRKRMVEGLTALGFDTLPSSANFVFTRHPTQSGAALAAALRERAILVRRWDAPRIGEWLRITVGTGEQTDSLLTALTEIPA